MARTQTEGIIETITEAAFAVFGERGFGGTTIKEIATRAGIASGTIYTYYADKEQLFRAVVQIGWDRIIHELENIGEGDQSLDVRFERLLDTGFKTLADSVPLIKGMISDSSRLNLVSDNLSRLCEVIETRIFPSQPGMTGERPNIVYIMVTGILFTIAFAEPADTGRQLEAIKQAMRGLYDNNRR